MKKIIVNEYGSVDVLKEIDVPMPTPKSDEVVIKVAAFGINDPDIVMRKNGPFPTMPKEMRPTLPHMLGNDFSGIVSQVGSNVIKFKVGDHVVGFSMQGSNAEYLTLNQNGVVITVPEDLDLVPLGGLLLGAVTAWSAVVLNGKIQAGQKILIHGGAGGVGTMAIQIAKNLGAYVITTAKAKHTEYLKELGADEIIDYQTQDFTKMVHDLDLVVNLTGSRTLDQSYQVIKPGGILTSVNGVPDPKKAAKFGIQAVYAMGDVSNNTITEILKMYVAGKLQVNVSQTYPFVLKDVKQAHLDFEKGSNQGKRIIVLNTK
ncbi:NADP-dependent oxidoreductase [Companilactobacillus kimchiensis]|uniref:Oxidoreductase n=1 Tax=Companilactobacillus kimchiensis TaxID=993692 RepID=A0A0R2LPM6_9LACO|nr:NADP-dependent oxidoreductase [Companilactobacillus kimchiensis]KRO00707.1 oxidoreductase [Companilactobacillus kimchiensis]